MTTQLLVVGIILAQVLLAVILVYRQLERRRAAGRTIEPLLGLELVAENRHRGTIDGVEVETSWWAFDDGPTTTEVRARLPMALDLGLGIRSIWVGERTLRKMLGGTGDRLLLKADEPARVAQLVCDAVRPQLEAAARHADLYINDQFVSLSTTTTNDAWKQWAIKLAVTIAHALDESRRSVPPARALSAQATVCASLARRLSLHFMPTPLGAYGHLHGFAVLVQVVQVGGRHTLRILVALSPARPAGLYLHSRSAGTWASDLLLEDRPLQRLQLLETRHAQAFDLYAGRATWAVERLTVDVLDALWALDQRGKVKLTDYALSVVLDEVPDEDELAFYLKGAAALAQRISAPAPPSRR